MCDGDIPEGTLNKYGDVIEGQVHFSGLHVEVGRVDGVAVVGQFGGHADTGHEHGQTDVGQDTANYDLLFVVELEGLVIGLKSLIQIVGDCVKGGVLRASGMKMPMRGWSVAMYIRNSWLFWPTLEVVTCRMADVEVVELVTLQLKVGLYSKSMV